MAIEFKNRNQLNIFLSHRQSTLMDYLLKLNLGILSLGRKLTGMDILYYIFFLIMNFKKSIEITISCPNLKEVEEFITISKPKKYEKINQPEGVLYKFYRD